MGLVWPLTGRSEEMRLIHEALSASDVAGIVIQGGPGVGKSRVAREALSSAEVEPCEVRWIMATSSSRVLPLGAFASWIGPTVPDSVELVNGLIASLTATLTRAPVVVGVDDAHLLDDLSMFVLHQIIQRHAAKLVLTVRTAEPIPPGIQDIWKLGEFRQLDLQPLSHDETAELAAAALGGPWVPHSADRLWELTRGNVLYLRNIVEQELADGRLAQQKDGLWRWCGEPVIPPGLVEMVESRIGSLPTAVSDVVDALAVGEPLELRALSRVTDASAVEEADLRGLITVEHRDGGVEVRLAHPLYREVRKGRVAPTRLRRLRGLIAKELGASDNREDGQIVVRRATLTLDSDLEPDPDLFVTAAYGAVRLMDMPLADRLTCAAIRAGGSAEARFIRAYVLSASTRGSEAEAVLAAISTAELSDADRARLAFLRARNKLFAFGDPAAAKEIIDQADALVPASARGCIDAFHTVYWAVMGQPDAALESAKHFDLEDLHPIAAEAAAWAIAVSCGEAGLTAQAVRAAQAGYLVASRGLIVLADAHVSALVLAGRIPEAQAVAQWLARRVGVTPAEGELTTVDVARHAALGAGRLDAASSLPPPVAISSHSGAVRGSMYRCQIRQATALAMHGLTTAAATALQAVGKHQHTPRPHLEYEYALAQGWVAAAEGAVSEASRIVLSAAERAGANGQFAAEVVCRQTAAQFGDRSGAGRLYALKEIVEGPRAGVAARFAAAVCSDDGTELASVSKEFEAMGDIIAAADAAAHAAVAFQGKGLRGKVLTNTQRAQTLAEQCGGAVTPALRLASEPLPLTARQREIVMLLRMGLTSPDIATRLTLSVRSVEGHIYRAMATTGTTCREELAALLGPLEED